MIVNSNMMEMIRVMIMILVMIMTKLMIMNIVMTRMTRIMATQLKCDDGDISGGVGFVEEEYNNKLTRRVLATAYAR